MSFERNTAIKCTVNEILIAPFVKKDGFESSYCITDYGEVARLNILGVIVNVEGLTITLDDGTGKITVRSFEPLKNTPTLGDVVTIIGKPRMYNNEKYIVPEIVKVIDNKKWIDHRKQELKERIKVKVTLPKKAEPVEVEIKKEFVVEPKEETIEEVSEESTNPFSQIKEFIKKEDDGGGVSIAKLELLKIKNLEEVIKNLLSEGELYEVRPGFIKILE